METAGWGHHESGNFLGCEVTELGVQKLGPMGGAQGSPTYFEPLMVTLR